MSNISEALWEKPDEGAADHELREFGTWVTGLAALARDTRACHGLSF
jgi:hypothetical protein